MRASPIARRSVRTSSIRAPETRTRKTWTTGPRRFGSGTSSRQTDIAGSIAAAAGHLAAAAFFSASSARLCGGGSSDEHGPDARAEAVERTASHGGRAVWAARRRRGDRCDRRAGVAVVAAVAGRPHARAARGGDRRRSDRRRPVLPWPALALTGVAY